MEETQAFHYAPDVPVSKMDPQRESISNPLNMNFASIKRAESTIRAAGGPRPSTAGAAFSRPPPQMAPSASARTLQVSNSQPAWITFDREVLRFYAYFQEPVLEYGFRSAEKMRSRTRKCVLLYYLADSTISIDEPKTKNSGLTQGRFMKRTRVKQANGAPYRPGDFSIGTHVEVFKRDFHIVDADPKTRRYFEETIGQPLGPAEPYPEDGYEQKRAHLETVYMERSASRKPTLVTSTSRGSLNPETQELKVLRFFCAYEDDRELGMRHNYTLHYFLDDDTVEVKENFSEGTHPFPCLLRRGPLARDALEPPSNPIEEYPRNLDHVSWEDLRCGDTLSVYGRPILMMSCDGQTEKWYEARGIVQVPMQIAAEKDKNEMRKLPPYNGFGSEDDMYAMGLSLQPKTSSNQQDDYARFMSAGNPPVVLRFECKLANCSEADSQRTLVVNYYLADDTVSVFEPPIRNSGIVGGTFLVRTRYKKYIPTEGRPLARGSIRPRGGVLSRWLRPTDFKPGALITFELGTSGTILYTFRIGQCDEFTRKKVEEGALADYPQSKLALMLTLIAEKFCAARLQVRTAFKQRDTFGAGSVPEAEFRAVVRELEAEAAKTDAQIAFKRTLTDEELGTFVWEYADARDAGAGAVDVLYNDFVDALSLAAPLPRLPDGTAREEKKEVEKTLYKLLRMQFNKEEQGRGRLRESFRAVDDTGEGHVTPGSWFQVLRKHRFHGVLTRQVAEALRKKYSKDELDQATGDAALRSYLDYNSLCDVVFPGDFNSYVSRLLLVLSDASNVAAGEIPHPEVERRAMGRAGAADKRDRAMKERALVASMRGVDQKKTVGEELRTANATRRQHGGVLVTQLAKACKAFSSAFGRNHRRKMLTKSFRSFDTANTGTINKAEFAASLDRIVGQGFCDFAKTDNDLIIGFMFPHDHTRHNYDQLQALLIARDAYGLVRLRNEIVGAPDNPALVFDASKVEIIDAYANDLAGMTLPGGGMGNDEED